VATKKLDALGTEKHQRARAQGGAIVENSLEQRVLDMIQQLKQGPTLRQPWLPIAPEGKVTAWLEPVSWLDADRPQSIALLARWREDAALAFPTQFPVTLAGTQRWLIRQLLEVPDRVLFWVTTLDGTRLGHVGLFRFDFPNRHVELDNVVRGQAGVMPGIVFAAIHTLLGWTFQTLQMQTLLLRVYSDSERTLRLYSRCGFRETQRVPVLRRQEGSVVHWDEGGDPNQPASRHLVTMGLPFAGWRAATGPADAAA